MAEQENPMRKIITRCWDDEAFKERLLADPAATLAAEGVQLSLIHISEPTRPY